MEGSDRSACQTSESRPAVLCQLPSVCQSTSEKPRGPCPRLHHRAAVCRTRALARLVHESKARRAQDGFRLIVRGAEVTLCELPVVVPPFRSEIPALFVSSHSNTTNPNQENLPVTNFLKRFHLISFNAQLIVHLDSLIRPSRLVKKVLDPVWGWKEIKKRHWIESVALQRESGCLWLINCPPAAGE